MLRHLIRSPSTPRGLALRSRIVLAASVGQSNQQIAATLRIPEVTAGKWRRTFATACIDGLQDAPRTGRPQRDLHVVLDNLNIDKNPAACRRRGNVRVVVPRIT